MREASYPGDISVAGSSVARSSAADRLALTLLAFAVATAAFVLVPPFLRGPVGTTPGFTGEEAVDLLTPIVTMPLLALALELTGRFGRGWRLVFVALAAAWVAGQGIHLAANALGNLFPAGPARDAWYLTDAGKLDFFFDEVLGHWLWHLAWFGLLLVLLRLGTAEPDDGARDSAGIRVGGLAGLVHAVPVTVAMVQGATWPLGIPTAVGFLVVTLVVRARRDAWPVVAIFLATSAATTILLFGSWIVLAGWPPVPPCHVIACP